MEGASEVQRRTTLKARDAVRDNVPHHEACAPSEDRLDWGFPPAPEQDKPGELRWLIASSTALGR